MARRNPSIESPSLFWDLVIKAGALVAFLLLVACIAIPLRPRIAEYRAMEEAGKVLEARRAELQLDIQRREAELQMLERDPLFVEMKARDTLDMCQAGEVVFRFEETAAGQ